MTKILTHEQLSDATQLKKGIARFATEQEAIDQLLNNVIIYYNFKLYIINYIYNV